MRIHSNNRTRVTEEEEDEEKEFISNLPDEIIVSILSRLDTIEQQARTSAVARRWRYLWKSSPTTNLVLVLEYDDRCSEFICHVNQVIKAALTTSTNIDTFELEVASHDTEGIYQHDIDEWLNFALQKRVKRLNLDSWFYYKRTPYSLNDSPAMSSIRNQSVVLDSLTSLRLCNVDVSGDNLEYILYLASPLLEELSLVDLGPSLVKFTISGWSLKLKRLEFCNYCDLEHLDIHDVNLEWLKYYGDGKCLTIRDTPHIVNACFRFSRDGMDMNFANRILSNLPQLRKLQINFHAVEELNRFLEFSKLRDLKKLELEVRSHIFSLRSCALLLDLFPSLTKFRIKFKYVRESYKGDKVSRLKNPHQSLKKVEIVGFIGCQLDLGVALYLIENIASLETMIVDTDRPYSWKVVDPQKREAARALARTHLEPKLSSQTKMTVL